MVSEILKTWHELMSGDGLDNYSNYGGDTDHKNDYVIYSKTRDSDILTESNFDCILESLKEIDSENVYTLSFGHWACGWIEHIFLKADSKAVNTAEEILNALSDYPVVDDSDYSDRQCKAIDNYWDSLSLSEKIDYCKAENLSIFSARTLPEEVQQKLYDEIY